MKFLDEILDIAKDFLRQKIVASRARAAPVDPYSHVV
jgi:hypothetical protein